MPPLGDSFSPSTGPSCSSSPLKLLYTLLLAVASCAAASTAAFCASGSMSRVSHRGPSMLMMSMPSGAVRMMENTAVVRMSLPHCSHLSKSGSSVLFFMMYSRGSLDSAACTVALGIHDRAMNSFSLKFIWPKEHEKNATGRRMESPMHSSRTERGMVSGVRVSNLMADPITPNSSGWNTICHATASLPSTSCAKPLSAPAERRPLPLTPPGAHPLAHILLATMPSMSPPMAPPPPKWTYLPANMISSPSRKITALRLAGVSHSAVMLARDPASAPARRPESMSTGPCMMVHARLPLPEDSAKDLQMV
mmetsp:Transcript_37353/g.92367  ORF Transcript_37353/g.92367 Transcript_37353/m.92367 type:complete len:308 (+) Transcript_37353:657-1580(+)